MPFFYVPFGKDSKKYWTGAFFWILLLGLFGYLVLYLQEGINSGDISNPFLYVVYTILRPVGDVLLYMLAALLKWGILAVVPITIFIFGVLLLVSVIINRVEAILRKIRNVRER